MEYNKKNVGEIFKKIASDKKNKIIKEVIGNNNQVEVWDPVKDLREKFKVKLFDEHAQRLVLYPGEEQSELVGINIMLTFEYKKLQYFLAETLVYDLDKNEYHVDTAGTLLKCDHRQNVRIPTRFLDKLELKINNQEGFIFPCLDFSAGGVCVYVDLDKAAIFKKNRMFSQVSLEINSTSFQIPTCRVLYVREVEDGMNVGIIFEELPLFTKKELKSFVQRMIYQIVKKGNS